MSFDQSFDDSLTITIGGMATAGTGRVLSIGQVVGGDYKLKSLLGRGGMGYVFCAEHIIIKRDYALKLLAPEMLNEVSKRRFETEGRAIANLDHVNIVKVYNMGIDEGNCPFYVMDLLDGIPLSDCIAEHKSVEFGDCLDIFSQIASGLDYAHSKGIIHRDVKPSNVILLTQPGGRLLVKIVDFGIAKMLSKSSFDRQSQTAAGEIFGSPYYMSPEQCLGDSIDARSDIYSLGCSLYEALSGRPPFDGQNALDTMMMHQSKAIPSIVAAQPEKSLPQSVDALLAKMMAKRPEDRYQSMKQVLHDIERLKAGKLIGKTAGESAFGNVTGPILEQSPDQRNDTADNTGKKSNVIFASLLGLPLIAALVWGAVVVSQPKSKVIVPAASVFSGPSAATSASPSRNSSSVFDKLPAPIAIDNVTDRNSRALPDDQMSAARRAYDRTKTIAPRFVKTAEGMRKKFSFPAASIGRIGAKGVERATAVGDMFMPVDVPIDLDVRASECAAIELPGIFKKIAPDAFDELSLEGSGQMADGPKLPPGKSQADKLVQILTTVTGWSHLRALSITAFALDEGVLTALDQLKIMEKLELHKCVWPPDAVQKRPFLDRLLQLQLDKVENVDQLVPSVAGSENLRSIKFDQACCSPAVFLQLKKCPNLEVVEICKAVVKDELLKVLTQIPQIRKVRFSGFRAEVSQLQILLDGPAPKMVSLGERDYSPAEKEALQQRFPSLRWDHK